MLYDDLVKAIELIAIEHPDGFTVDLRNLELARKGIAVGFAATQNCYGFGGLYRCVEHAFFEGGFVGGWRNQDGRMQYDSIRLFESLPEAIAFGRKQNQIAIYDLENAWEIIL